MKDSEWDAHLARFRALIDGARAYFAGIGDDQAALRPRPGKWSKKEIVGHLVDSASNNHQRFVRTRFQADLVFPGYEQDEWVAAQRYQDAPWDELVVLWHALNSHLHRVMASTPHAVREKLHSRHNLDAVAYKAHAQDTPGTLGWFMADYVDHLEHHLRQAGYSGPASAGSGG